MFLMEFHILYFLGRHIKFTYVYMPGTHSPSKRVCINGRRRHQIHHCFQVVIRFDALRPSRHIFSHDITFPGLNRYKTDIKVPCSSTQQSAAPLSEVEYSTPVPLSSSLVSV